MEIEFPSFGQRDPDCFVGSKFIGVLSPVLCGTYRGLIEVFFSVFVDFCDSWQDLSL